LLANCAVGADTAAPHLLQNSELGSFWVPHWRQNMIPLIRGATPAAR
jgi:hypothetical protein